MTAWPFGERNYPQLDRAGSRVLPISSSRSAGRLIGDAVHPATTGPVGITAGDGLRHTWLLGPTGVGKSTVIEHQALQDIEAGRGVVVIDPKGDLVEGLLARMPDKHTDRVVVVDPARTDRVVGFNPLAVRSGSRELAADNVLHVIKSLNRESWGPRTQDILHAALLTLASSARPSLVLVPQLLIDQQLRDNLLKTPGTGGSPALATFWQWFDALSDAERSAVIAPVLNKLRPFTMRSSLRAMLGQTQPSFDLASVFTRRRVVLMPLRRGLIGSEAANLVGALLLSQLWQQAQHRARLDSADRYPVFVYLDEFQDYLALPTDLTDVLAQARGLGVGLVLAHQHLAQLSPDVRAAVAANAQNQIVFRLQGDDATAIAKRTNALDTVDFTSLRAFSAYAAILEGGQRGEYGSIRTRPPRPALRNHRQLADALAAQWGTPPSAVDDALYGQAGYRRNGDLGDENGDGGWPVGSRPRRPT